MIHIYKKSDADAQFEEIKQPEPGCWIHIDQATTSDINWLSKLTNLEYSDISDCLDKYEIPRIEKIDDSVLIFTRHPETVVGGLHTTTFTIVLSKDYIITICPSKSHVVDNFLIRSPRISPDSQKSTFLIYFLLNITQDYTRQIKKIRTNVLKQEKHMAYIDSQDITNLTINEEILNQYISSLVPLRSVLEAITSGRYTSLHEKDQDLLDDLLNASIQSEDLCSINLRSIRSLRDSYQILFTNQLNKTIKLLTALTIILSIPTMVASLYGMNVDLPIAGSPLAFAIIMVFIIFLSFISLLVFQRKKWL